jgi:NAD(P)-dependent dehydrogenase (short-subunit alcohol dehydrogenase family)
MRKVFELMNMRGRTALITGGAGHIGRVAADTLAELGASIVLLDINGEACEKAAADLRATWNTKVTPIVADLEDETAVRDVSRRVAEEHGSLHVLVHAAALVGIMPLEGWAVPFSQQSAATWRRAFEVNLTSFFVLTQSCEQLLRTSSGSIIAISSIYGVSAPVMKLYEGTKLGNPAAYAASKGGLLQMVRYLSTTLSPDVRVNAISPGGVSRRQPEEFVERYVERTPLGRMATEEDLKGAVAYFASDLSAYVTGQNLLVDGGWTAW